MHRWPFLSIIQYMELVKCTSESISLPFPFVPCNVYYPPPPFSVSFFHFSILSNRLVYKGFLSLFNLWFFFFFFLLRPPPWAAVSSKFFAKQSFFFLAGKFAFALSVVCTYAIRGVVTLFHGGGGGGRKERRTVYSMDHG